MEGHVLQGPLERESGREAALCDLQQTRGQQCAHIQHLAKDAVTFSPDYKHLGAIGLKVPPWAAGTDTLFPSRYTPKSERRNSPAGNSREEGTAGGLSGRESVGEGLVFPGPSPLGVPDRPCEAGRLSSFNPWGKLGL